MDTNVAIPLGAMIVSLASLLISGLVQGRAVTKDTMTTLQAELNSLERRIELCEQTRDALAAENHRLLLELLGIKREGT